MKNLFCKIRMHSYRKCISEYLSFNFRKIYYKCDCCNETKVKIYNFDYIYPFKTSDKFEVNEFKKLNKIC